MRYEVVILPCIYISFPALDLCNYCNRVVALGSHLLLIDDLTVGLWCRRGRDRSCCLQPENINSQALTTIILQDFKIPSMTLSCKLIPSRQLGVKHQLNPWKQPLHSRQSDCINDFCHLGRCVPGGEVQPFRYPSMWLALGLVVLAWGRMKHPSRAELTQSRSRTNSSVKSIEHAFHKRS